MPAFVKQAQSRGQFFILEISHQRPQLFECLCLHLLLAGFSVMIQVVEFLRQCHRLFPVIRDQAADTNTHILHTPRRIQPGRNGKSQVGRHQVSIIPFPQPQKRQQTGRTNTLPDSLHALSDQDPVIVIKGNEISHRAQRHEVQQVRQVGLTAREGKPVTFPQGLS